MSAFGAMRTLAECQAPDPGWEQTRMARRQPVKLHWMSWAGRTNPFPAPGCEGCAIGLPKRTRGCS
jgi:hypothetical protein